MALNSQWFAYSVLCLFYVMSTSLDNNYMNEWMNDHNLNEQLEGKEHIH